MMTMRMMFRTLATAAAVVAITGAVCAAQAKPAQKPAVKASKVMTATGTVSKFDAATNTLTVTTSKGDEQFVLGSSAPLIADGKKIVASDLSTHAGNKVTVRYTESDGQKMAQSVRVTAAAPKAAAKKPAAKKPAT